MIRALLEADADVNRQLSVFCDILGIFETVVTPLTLTVMTDLWRAACILLDGGADFDAKAEFDSKAVQAIR